MTKIAKTSVHQDERTMVAEPHSAGKNFQTGNAHLYRLGANAEPGNGSIDDMGRGVDHLYGAVGRGGQLCLLFVV
jgi:hypothetical protein